MPKSPSPANSGWGFLFMRAMKCFIWLLCLMCAVTASAQTPNFALMTSGTVPQTVTSHPIVIGSGASVFASNGGTITATGGTASDARLSGTGSLNLTGPGSFQAASILSTSGSTAFTISGFGDLTGPGGIWFVNHVGAAGFNYVTAGSALFTPLIEDANGNHVLTMPGDGSVSAPGLTAGGLTYNFYPESYGAVGNGTTNDLPAIQSAVNAAEATPGGRVILQNKTYAISGSLSITTACSIEGVGVFELCGPFSTGTGASAIGSVNIPVISPYLIGSVLLETASNTDIIDCSAVGQKVDFAGLGFLFSPSIRFLHTGSAISCIPSLLASGTGRDSGVWATNWKDLAVYGNDGSHYGFYVTNPLEGTWDNLRSYGGGGLCIDENSPNTYYGNLVIGSFYNALLAGGTTNGIYLKDTLDPDPTGPIGAGGHVGPNLIVMARPQVNAGTSGTIPGMAPVTSSQNTIRMDVAGWIEISQADMESNSGCVMNSGSSFGVNITGGINNAVGSLPMKTDGLVIGPYPPDYGAPGTFQPPGFAFETITGINGGYVRYGDLSGPGGSWEEDGRIASGPNSMVFTNTNQQFTWGSNTNTQMSVTNFNANPSFVRLTLYGANPFITGTGSNTATIGISGTQVTINGNAPNTNGGMVLGPLPTGSGSLNAVTSSVQGIAATTTSGTATLSGTLTGATTLSVSTTGTSVLPIIGADRTSAVITAGTGSGSYTASIVLSGTNTSATSNPEYLIKLAYPASSNPTVNFYDGGTSGTLLASFTNTLGNSGTTEFIAIMQSGTNWTWFPKGAVLNSDLYTGVKGNLATQPNTTGGLMTFSGSSNSLYAGTSGTTNAIAGVNLANFSFVTANASGLSTFVAASGVFTPLALQPNSVGGFLTNTGTAANITGTLPVSQTSGTPITGGTGIQIRAGTSWPNLTLDSTGGGGGAVGNASYAGSALALVSATTGSSSTVTTSGTNGGRGIATSSSNVVISDTNAAGTVVFSGTESGNGTINLWAISGNIQATGQFLYLTTSATASTNYAVNTNSSVTNFNANTTLNLDISNTAKFTQTATAATEAGTLTVTGLTTLNGGLTTAGATVGTFTLSSGVANVVNTNFSATSVVLCTLKTASGSAFIAPVVTGTAGTGFGVNGATTDSSTYNYKILN
jgi:hypothetical protein